MERYWACATTLEEEEALRRFFFRDDVPARLAKYRPWFVEAASLKAMKPGDGFEERVAQAAGIRPVKALRVTFRRRMLPLLRAVAVVAVLFAAGAVAQYALDEEASRAVGGHPQGNVPENAQMVREQKPSALVNICEGASGSQAQVRDTVRGKASPGE